MDSVLENLVGALCMFGTAWWARLHFKSWLAPSALFSTYWGAIVLVTLATPFRSQLWPGATYSILFCIGLFHIGSVAATIGRAVGCSNRVQMEAQHRRTVLFNYGGRIVALCAVVGGVSVLVILESSGVSLETLSSLSAVTQAAHRLSVERYAGEYTMPPLARIFTAFIYLGSFVGGAWTALVKRMRPTDRRHRWIVGFLLIPAIMQATILTTRTSLLLPCLFFVATYVTVSIPYGRLFELRSRFRVAMCAGIMATVLFVVFVGIQVLRTGSGLSSLNASLVKVVAASPVAGLIAFSQWFEETLGEAREVAFGRHTFAGIFDLLGISPRRMGLYEDRSALGFDGASTNIYTIYRGLISDFSFLGTAVFLFVGGFGTGWVFLSARRGDLGACAILALIIAFGGWSHVVSILNYNTVVAAWSAYGLLTVIGAGGHGGGGPSRATRQNGDDDR